MQDKMKRKTNASLKLYFCFGKISHKFFQEDNRAIFDIYLFEYECLMYLENKTRDLKKNL